jgi:hypothetical protein
MAPILGIYASQISGHLFAPSGAYDSIATASGSASAYDLTSIPSTYEHLELRFLIKDARGTFNSSAMYLRFNGDTGSNYAVHSLMGNGTAASAEAITSATSIQVETASSVQTDVFSVAVIQILDYKSTSKFKTLRILSGFDFNGAAGVPGKVTFGSALWQSTSAITSINITPFTANFNANSQVALYGIRGN